MHTHYSRRALNRCTTYVHTTKPCLHLRYDVARTVLPTYLKISFKRTAPKRNGVFLFHTRFSAHDRALFRRK
jgi:hypothetical protein